MNDAGRVANEVEIEQVVDAGFDWRTGFPLLASLVQVWPHARVQVMSLPSEVSGTSEIQHTVLQPKGKGFPERSSCLLCSSAWGSFSAQQSASHAKRVVLLQMRGSIPLYWVQDTASVSPINPKPAIQLQQYDPHYSATRLHFQASSITHQVANLPETGFEDLSAALFWDS